jgi:SAM-dependent methyltransferase
MRRDQHLPPPPRRRASVANRVRHALGLRQWFVVEGVRYREVASESMRRALSRKGTGSKEYEVVFPDGTSMQIHASTDRIFADLIGLARFAVYSRSERLLLPGMRVLLLPGGTGYAGNWAATRVAPSGAVVSLEPDEESVLYARRRYRAPNVSFEIGGVPELTGETDGAFDAVLAAVPDDEPGRDKTLTELWRVVSPGGWLLALAHGGPSGDALIQAASQICRSGDRATMSLNDRSAEWNSAVFRRPAEE